MRFVTGSTNLYEINPALLLNAYAQGVFPMSDDAEDPEVFWVKPKLRGVIPLDAFHLPRSLAKTIRQKRFSIRFDHDFNGVITGCAESRPGREHTWINAPIRKAYKALFECGHCHTVEAWRKNELVGGLYGVTLNGAFFGESMFSRQTDASKVCLAALVEHLNVRGFTLLDTQFLTDHLAHFGAIEIAQQEYEDKLKAALMNDQITF